MSEEEKKAIESFKKENNNDLSRFDDFNSYTQFKVKRDKIIINLIDNQQKEIEELKQNRDEYKEEYIKLLNARYYNYISKNKIREKIKELEGMSISQDIYYADIKEMFEELLEEK